MCGASRASLLTGVRPTPTRFTVAKSSADEDLPGHLSIPRYLKQNGYTTLSIGKVYHVVDDDLAGWSAKPSTVKSASGGNYMNPENTSRPTASLDEDNQARGPAFEIGEETDDFKYRDGLLAKKANGLLDTLKNSDKPFFLAVGFFKPHLPFVAPKKYYDLYKREDIKLAANQYVPQGAPAVAISGSGELRTRYTGVPKDRILPDDYAVSLRHAYFASISFVDAMIGEVLKKVETAGLADNTIIVLVGDHGWNLGEHTIWGKHNSFQTALRSPLIISAPSLTKNQKSASLAEFVDIYPTLAELTGLPVPEHCQGKSLVPVLKNPKAAVKEEVYCRWRGGEGVHTKSFAYTEWYDPKTKAVSKRMLYDLKKDAAENVNVADKPEYKKTADLLSLKLKQNIASR